MNCEVEGCGVLLAVGCDEEEERAKALSHQLWYHPTMEDYKGAWLRWLTATNRVMDSLETGDGVEHYQALQEMFEETILVKSWAARELGL